MYVYDTCSSPHGLLRLYVLLDFCGHYHHCHHHHQQRQRLLRIKERTIQYIQLNNKHNQLQKELYSTSFSAIAYRLITC